jgi:hypothetical protein
MAGLNTVKVRGFLRMLSVALIKLFILTGIMWGESYAALSEDKLLSPVYERNGKIEEGRK